MKEWQGKGAVPWNENEILEALPDFLKEYSRRPIQMNENGMRSPHMFATWFMLRKLNPDLVVESGVWRGQGTWIIEKACPQSKIVCLDIDLKPVQYRSPQAQYFETDFTKMDWGTESKDRAVLFFDDHQNALDRVRQAKAIGFKHLIFEDNYPPNQGDCYSLKKAFMANDKDADWLFENLEAYGEFPPPFRQTKTRWGDAWDLFKYPTPEPFLLAVENQEQQLLWDETRFYTWICYAKLK